MASPLNYVVHRRVRNAAGSARRERWDPCVRTPRPPDDCEAWYALDILAQRTVHPGVVTTVREREGVFVVSGSRIVVSDLI
ncbi:MAG: hypothetical protein V5A27_01070 [Halapricum sp.]